MVFLVYCIKFLYKKLPISQNAKYMYMYHVEMLNTESFQLLTWSLKYNISEAFFNLKGKYHHDQQDMD